MLRPPRTAAPAILNRLCIFARPEGKCGVG